LLVGQDGSKYNKMVAHRFHDGAAVAFRTPTPGLPVGEFIYHPSHLIMAIQLLRECLAIS
jgi:hypothetical protein